LTTKDGHGAALFAGFLGWTLDAFDFFLVVFALTAIAQEFHRADKEIAFSITLTLAFRPVGAFIFGLMADRYGRRIPLMIDLVFYSLVEVATGFAHSYTSFLVLRALFGIGMGGEWGVGASLAMEKVPPRLRGFHPASCSRDMLWEIFSRLVVSSLSFHAGAGGQCFSLEDFPLYSGFSSASA
jgi:MFS family permease